MSYFREVEYLSLDVFRMIRNFPNSTSRFFKLRRTRLRVEISGLAFFKYRLPIILIYLYLRVRFPLALAMKNNTCSPIKGSWIPVPSPKLGFRSAYVTLTIEMFILFSMHRYFCNCI